ncbi:hypothetical protein E2C01_001151 [Portunus trituberculatus]|uniref:Uncharacterized protein n=1 Tax=Portunus trituberculatus TaxID=210409 RepID=A0A5B7CFZ3_PORTR|nr:hypothetical protein [Portunus trituberculatus]
MSELMNESFKSIFYEEGEFIEPSHQATQEGLRGIMLEKQKIKELLEKVDKQLHKRQSSYTHFTLTMEVHDESLEYV